METDSCCEELQEGKVGLDACKSTIVAIKILLMVTGLVNLSSQTF